MIRDIIEKNNIKNKELIEILKYVRTTPIFLEESKRLLSEDEIINYKKELNTELEIIPLIDLCDNNYLIYDIAKEKFYLLDISTDEIWKEINSISHYINLLKENKQN